MSARFRPLFKLAARVCCTTCQREFSLGAFAGHHLDCAQEAYEAEMQHIDDTLLGYAT